MRTAISVKNRKEGEAIRRALADPETRALVLVMGALLALPSDRARERALRFVDDQFAEQDAQYVSVFSR